MACGMLLTLYAGEASASLDIFVGSLFVEWIMLLSEMDLHQTSDAFLFLTSS